MKMCVYFSPVQDYLLCTPFSLSDSLCAEFTCVLIFLGGMLRELCFLLCVLAWWLRFSVTLVLLPV